MSRFANNLYAQFAASIWAIEPMHLLSVYETRNHEVTIDASAVAEATEAAARRSVAKLGGGAVAVVPLTGTITPQGSFIQMLLGIPGGLEGFRAAMSEALADPEVKAIVMNIDSPGGIVDQVPETAAFLREARKVKPIVAVSNPMSASAAYWLASQATQVVGSTSSLTGSIGVYQMHRDLSGAHEQAGIKPTLISAGKYKVEGNPFQPLTDTAAANIQSEVNDFYDLFVKDVALGRGVAQQAVRDGYGQGRVLTAKRAQTANLVDSTATLDAVVSNLAAGRMPARRAHKGDMLLDGVRAEELVDDTDLELFAEDVQEPEASEPEAITYSTEDKTRIMSVLAG